MNTTKLVLYLLLLCASLTAKAVEWQWSVPYGNGRAFLWIPPHCDRVRGVVVGNHNIIEQGILEHAAMRRTLGELNFAAIWVVRGMSIQFDFNAGDDQGFERIVKALAEESGYDELARCPVVPMGHSANATWVWNFAAWKPERTLAVLSLHGDAPQTLLTGYGGDNVCWGSRTIDGVPGLMVMAEYEWWDARLWPAMTYRVKHPKTPLAMLCDAGNGHMNASDGLVDFLGLFIRKAAAARLQPDGLLKPIDTRTGWLLDRWRKDQTGGLVAGTFGSYTGNVDEAFWCFDEEMVKAQQDYYARSRGKKPQLIGFDGATGGRVEPKLELLDDGLSFRLQPAFVDRVPDDGHARGWTGLPTGVALGHATGKISMGWIFGPAVQTGTNTFRLCFNRADSVPDGRNNEIWLFAANPGDAEYKPMVQPALLRVPNFGGAEQHLTFPEIPDQPVGTRSVKLHATSDAGLPVQYYVREGPAEIEGDSVVFTGIPPRSRMPVSVTVVASWQLGRGGASPVKRAAPVARTFHIIDRSLTAATPPMGWNSYDAWGTSVTEAEVLANAVYMQQHLLSHGWKYVVIDARWYDSVSSFDDRAFNRERVGAKLFADQFGRMLPATNRFPSAVAGNGFKPFADKVHAMGLKCGLHMMRGIPQQAVQAKTPIEGSTYTAADAGDTKDICSWCPDMFGVRDNPAGQAWYDSCARLWASWGLDFVKVDDLSAPYHAPEIEMMRKALDKCGRPIVFSTSPGPIDPKMAAYIAKHANMWRISGDFWDRWGDLNKAFDLIAQWQGVGGPGHWPDADMLPLGRIGIKCTIAGGDRQSRFTTDEQITLMTLWALAPSPLMLGANLPDLDAKTLELLTNDEVLSVNQYPLGEPATRQSQKDGLEVWRKPLADDSTAIGYFNRSNEPLSLKVPAGRDLWRRQDMTEAERVLQPHASILLRVQAK